MFLSSLGLFSTLGWSNRQRRIQDSRLRNVFSSAIYRAFLVEVRTDVVDGVISAIFFRTYHPEQNSKADSGVGRSGDVSLPLQLPEYIAIRVR